MPLCICDTIKPIDNRIELLILQHPQEQDRALGTARLAALHFRKAELKIGLSWPSLSKVIGRTVDPQRWAVLYLGSAKVADLETDRAIVTIDRKGAIEDSQRAILKGIEGIVLLDGTWSQAKALWWRNAWMLKCRRIILGPAHPSLYGKLRREPRRDGLSTIEAAGMLLGHLENRPEIETALKTSFTNFLPVTARYRRACQSWRRDLSQSATVAALGMVQPRKVRKSRGALNQSTVCNLLWWFRAFNPCGPSIFARSIQAFARGVSGEGARLARSEAAQEEASIFPELEEN